VSGADREITALARRQHGALSAYQLRAAGVSRTAVRTRIADGRLREVYRGVYALGPPTQRGRWMAATLALGEGAVLSHQAAAVLHGLRPAGSKVDVTLPRRARPRSGIAVHQVRALDLRDRTTVHRIPVTSVARTLLDLAEVLPSAQFQRAYEAAERLRVLDVKAIGELLGRSNGRRGGALLRSLVAYDPSRASEAASELELRFLGLLREARLSQPQVNVLVEGFVVDAYWPSARLVVELQGYAFHSGRAAFERDHRRLARLRLAGYEVLALTWRQVTREPDWVVGAIAALLERGLPGPAARLSDRVRAEPRAAWPSRVGQGNPR
jgi:very-short-patch-repair endonuclease